jgi:hypothetical protein
MSTLGHVLFLLPFLRDFTRSGCIASFLKSSGSRGRLYGTAGRQEGKLSCSQLAVIASIADIASKDTASRVIASRDTALRVTASRDTASNRRTGDHTPKYRRRIEGHLQVCGQTVPVSRSAPADFQSACGQGANRVQKDSEIVSEVR